MIILTSENAAYDINILPFNRETPLNYCVLDHSNNDDVDYKFRPLLFIEPGVIATVFLRVGGRYVISVPATWFILTMDQETSEVDIVPILRVSNMTYSAFAFNPISGFIPKAHQLEILDTYPEVEWRIPKLDKGHMLALPLKVSDNPECIFIVRDYKSISNNIEYSNLF